ncbi:hypothetical protein COLO4_20945 [Corchorus olitorius]|uniref:Uncharacterized protein n=1 Tax=Corchorus olitorius TaxID=93759 RepID=A0A1R3IW08_9ROSI|nr:hypothetical protein COLO4_20945 [Corchorus olitorius]
MASLIRSLHPEPAATFNELRALSFQDFNDNTSLGCSDSGDCTVEMASSFGVPSLKDKPKEGMPNWLQR